MQAVVEKSQGAVETQTAQTASQSSLTRARMMMSVSALLMAPVPSVLLMTVPVRVHPRPGRLAVQKADGEAPNTPAWAQRSEAGLETT